MGFALDGEGLLEGTLYRRRRFFLFSFGFSSNVSFMPRLVCQIYLMSAELSQFECHCVKNRALLFSFTSYRRSTLAYTQAIYYTFHRSLEPLGSSIALVGVKVSVGNWFKAITISYSLASTPELVRGVRLT